MELVPFLQRSISVYCERSWTIHTTGRSTRGLYTVCIYREGEIDFQGKGTGNFQALEFFYRLKLFATRYLIPQL